VYLFGAIRVFPFAFFFPLPEFPFFFFFVKHFWNTSSVLMEFELILHFSIFFY
jgi:hypothetical protein